MARVDVNFHPMARGSAGTPPQAFDLSAGASQTITSSGTSQQSAVCPALGAAMVCRVKTDGPVMISVGTNPNASSDAIKAWVTDELIFSVQPGQKVAVVDA
jgi:hypothetical protein